jgi:DNA-directed RNA polymerase beta subunit
MVNGRARKSYARTPAVLDLPRLTEVQIRSFEWFKTEGLKELLPKSRRLPVSTKTLELHFGDFYFGEPNIRKMNAASATSPSPRRCGSRCKLLNK